MTDYEMVSDALLDKWSHNLDPNLANTACELKDRRTKDELHAAAVALADLEILAADEDERFENANYVAALRDYRAAKATLADEGDGLREQILEIINEDLAVWTSADYDEWRERNQRAADRIFALLRAEKKNG